jgi:hypothetical protein
MLSHLKKLVSGGNSSSQLTELNRPPGHPLQIWNKVQSASEAAEGATEEDMDKKQGTYSRQIYFCNSYNWVYGSALTCTLAIWEHENCLQSQELEQMCVIFPPLLNSSHCTVQ